MTLRITTCFLIWLTSSAVLLGQDSKNYVWPDLAPGETSRGEGVVLPKNENDDPPITRVEKIRRPSFDAYLAEKPSGTAILILPGGGFKRVVPDLEGSEAVPMLNKLGISVFVLRYRTNETKPKSEPNWRRPLQDAQRALRLIRSQADQWKIKSDRVGVLGFSAGGQVAAILHAGNSKAAYESLDEVDKNSCVPNFSLLIYPWRVLNSKTETLLPEIKLGPKSPPAFIVHTHDDRSTSLGAVEIYAALKRNKVSAELHIYQNGGHGYGVRDQVNSRIGTWPQQAVGWLQVRGLANQ